MDYNHIHFRDARRRFVDFTDIKTMIASWFNHRNTLKLAFGQTRTQNDDNS